MSERQQIAEIERLKYRYLRLLDLKKWDEFADCFVPEVTTDYGNDLRFSSRDELVDYMRTNITPAMITQHHVHHPEITVDGGRAEGTWYLYDRVLVPEFDFCIEGAAFYSDRYVRTSEGWRISHTGYERTYELTYPLSSIPGHRLTFGPALAHTRVASDA